MESFHQAISAGMLSSYPSTVDTQESHELGPQARLKMAAAVRCKGMVGNPKREIRPDRKACVTISVVKRSTHVSK